MKRLNKNHEQIKKEFGDLRFKMNFIANPLRFILIIFFLIKIFFKNQFDKYIEKTNFMGIPSDMLFVGLAIIVLIVSLYMRFKWKCPNCNEGFGRNQNFKHCMHCGVQLED